MTDQAKPESDATPKSGGPGAKSKAALWVVLIACVGVIGFVATRLSDIQRDPELDFNLAKLEGDDHAARMKGLEVLNLIAQERAAGVAPRKIDRALPALTLALSDPSEEIRAGALVVLASIGPEASATASLIRENLVHEAPRVRAFSAQALASVRPDEPETLAGVLKVALDENENVSLMGIQALGGMGGRARSAVDDLIKLAANDKLRGAVENALRSIDADALSRLP
ncbi:MAG: HEAT repeat domain-containing protein [Verrucomicrobiia bacterium]|jgi:HEAT repeat protein